MCVMFWVFFVFSFTFNYKFAKLKQNIIALKHTQTQGICNVDRTERSVFRVLEWFTEISHTVICFVYIQPENSECSRMHTFCRITWRIHNIFETVPTWKIGNIQHLWIKTFHFIVGLCFLLSFVFLFIFTIMDLLTISSIFSMFDF